MNTEQKKLWLARYRQARYAEKEILREIEELEGQFILPARPMDGMPRGSSGGKDLSGFAAQYDKLRRKLLAQYEKRLHIYNEIVDAIEKSSLNETERSILRYRYILCLQWEQIEEAMHMDRTWMHRIRDRALMKLRFRNGKQQR